jgi:hypothetical protein
VKYPVEGGEVARLINRLRKATGADRGLDAHIHAVVHSLTDDPIGKGIREYTASEPACFELIHQVLPGWKVHVGYGVKGVFPYASVSNDHGKRFEAKAPTVPLALLLALMWAIAGS